MGSNRRLHKIRDTFSVRVLADIYPFHLCFRSFTSFCSSAAWLRLAAEQAPARWLSRWLPYARARIELDLEFVFRQADET